MMPNKSVELRIEGEDRNESLIYKRNYGHLFPNGRIVRERDNM